VVPPRLLERFAISPGQTPGRLHSLKQVEGVEESFILSTCNRVEYYVSLAATADPAAVAAALAGLLVTPSFAPLVPGGTRGLDEVRDLVTVSSEADAVSHLFSVACGLDSMVIGEQEVVAQLREALRLAEAEGAVGHVLGNLVRGALRTSKTVRTQTGIGSAGMSMVGVGLDWAEEALGGLAGKTALLVGAGRMSQRAGQRLRDAGVSSVAIASRTMAHAQALAGQVGGIAVALPYLGTAITSADIVVSCTGSPGYVVTADEVAAVAAWRSGRPMFMLDLAIPRDIDPVARDFPGVTVVDIEDISHRLRASSGTDDAQAAQSIVDGCVLAFQQRRAEDELSPLIVALRATADRLVDAELRRLHNRLPHLDHRVKRETGAAMRRATEKLIHTPTVRLKELATAPGGSMYRDALAALFDLEGVVES
jgi:glutamyl-tRNA reductase